MLLLLSRTKLLYPKESAICFQLFLVVSDQPPIPNAFSFIASSDILVKYVSSLLYIVCANDSELRKFLALLYAC